MAYFALDYVSVRDSFNYYITLHYITLHYITLHYIGVKVNNAKALQSLYNHFTIGYS